MLQGQGGLIIADDGDQEDALRRRLVLLLGEFVVARKTDFHLVAQNGEAVALKVVVHSHRIVRVVHLHQRLPHEELPFTSPDCWA